MVDSPLCQVQTLVERSVHLSKTMHPTFRPSLGRTYQDHPCYTSRFQTCFHICISPSGVVLKAGENTAIAIGCRTKHSVRDRLSEIFLVWFQVNSCVDRLQQESISTPDNSTAGNEPNASRILGFYIRASRLTEPRNGAEPWFALDIWTTAKKKRRHWTRYTRCRTSYV